MDIFFTLFYSLTLSALQTNTDVVVNTIDPAELSYQGLHGLLIWYLTNMPFYKMGDYAKFVYIRNSCSKQNTKKPDMEASAKAF